MQGSNTLESEETELDFSPEENLWVHVIKVLLEDLDRLTEFTKGTLIPRKKALENKLLEHVGTRYAPGIEQELKEVTDALFMAMWRLGELQSHIESDWAQAMCGFIGLSHKKLLNICHDILSGKLVVRRRFERSTYEIVRELKAWAVR